MTTVVVLVSAMVAVEGGTVADAAVPRAATTGVDAATAAALELLAYVPTSFRSRCSDLDSTFDDQAYAQAVVMNFVNSLNCSTEDGERVFYWKFDNAEGADAFLETLLTPANYADASTKLSDCPSATTYSTGEGKQKRRGGRVFCFLAGEGVGLPAGTPVVVWTDEKLGIVGQAFNAGDPEQVHRFFTRDSGPLAKPNRSGIPTARTTAARRSDGKDLLALVPNASALGCRIVDELSREDLGSLYRWRLWMVADVESCTPKDGPEGVEYVRFANTDAMHAYYESFGVPNPAPNAQELHGITCPGSNTYNARGVRNVGDVKCYFSTFDTQGNESADRYFHLEWSSKPTKVVAFAIGPEATEQAIVDWWADRGGPVID